MKIRSLLLSLVLVLSFALAACDFDGGVEQGRTVGYDEANKTITMVVDTTLDQHNPHYSGGVHTFKLPTDPRDMGPAPVEGGRLMLEMDKGMMLYYDRDDQKVKEMPVEFVNVQKGVTAKAAAGKKFPIVDKAACTVTVYSPRLESIVTFKVPESDIDLPEYVWTAGDEARIAFRKENKNQAIRFMNVSKTSIFTR
ncbi:MULTISPECIES: DUF4881 domain-containing protein [unclassified Desulfovibrio]|uniref:DUF4881 domain-containing protein n=1 Tax=unclassified Desulfovibrio TaxID=2593640 RepID=UPI0013EDEBF0|nr:MULTISPECIES: DUF4881 domain-containing protein [unclassified Desulfovibrio]